MAIKTVNLIELLTPGITQRTQIRYKILSTKNIHKKIKLFFSKYPVEGFEDDSPVGIPIDLVSLEKKWFEFIECK